MPGMLERNREIIQHSGDEFSSESLFSVFLKSGSVLGTKTKTVLDEQMEEGRKEFWTAIRSGSLGTSLVAFWLTAEESNGCCHQNYSSRKHQRNSKQSTYSRFLLALWVPRTYTVTLYGWNALLTTSLLSMCDLQPGQIPKHRNQMT